MPSPTVHTVLPLLLGKKLLCRALSFSLDGLESVAPPSHVPTLRLLDLGDYG